MGDCVFCRILAGESPASFVHQGDRVCAFLDIHPINPGHLLVVPRSHAETMSDLSELEAQQMMRVAQRLMRALFMTRLRCEGVNLFLADGAAAGQDVHHVHLHVIPRFSGDGFGLRFAPGYGAVPSRTDLDAIADALRQASNDAQDRRQATSRIGRSDS